MINKQTNKYKIIITKPRDHRIVRLSDTNSLCLLLLWSICPLLLVCYFIHFRPTSDDSATTSNLGCIILELLSQNSKMKKWQSFSSNTNLQLHRFSKKNGQLCLSNSIQSSKTVILAASFSQQRVFLFNNPTSPIINATK